MTVKFDFDLIIIGSGSAGYAAAHAAREEGMKVAVVEGSSSMAGLCILRGCMPTKTLLQSAEIYHLIRKSHVWGIQTSQATPCWESILERKNQLVQEWATFREDQWKDGSFEIFRSRGKFKSSHSILLEDGSELSASFFLIATGSRVSIPDIPGFSDSGYITSNEALSLSKLPSSMIVLGGGPVAIELAQFFCRMGVQVTVIQRSRHILKTYDTQASLILEESLQEEGMKVYTGTQIGRCSSTADGKRIEFIHQNQTRTATADLLLNALGRSPNTDSLDLHRCEVSTRNGYIEVQPTQQTKATHIFAAGDCCGPYEIVHLAVQQGETAVYNMVHPQKPRKMDYRCLTSIVFTDPQIASVGLSERQALNSKTPFSAASYAFSDHGKSVILDSKKGYVKLLADPKTGEILGGSVIGPLGGELIHEVVVAMSQRMTVHQLASVPHYHPTLSEIWTYPAEELARSIPASTPSRSRHQNHISSGNH